MIEKIQGVVLSEDAEKEFLAGLDKTIKREGLLRTIEHEKWIALQDKRIDLFIENDIRYRKHVSECNWQQRIQTLAVLIIAALVARFLL